MVSAPSPGCPFCQSTRITPIAVEGLRGELIAFRCDGCEKQWSEIAPEVKARRERAVPTERQAR
jgi:transposase-like protein